MPSKEGRQKQSIETDNREEGKNGGKREEKRKASDKC